MTASATPPRVFVVHPTPQNDLKPAENFGELEYINRRYVYGDEIDEGMLPSDVADRLVDAVRRFRPDLDYLLIAGDHLQIVTIAAYLARAHKRYQVLRFDREAGGYIPVWVDAR